MMYLIYNLALQGVLLKTDTDSGVLDRTLTPGIYSLNISMQTGVYNTIANLYKLLYPYSS